MVVGGFTIFCFFFANTELHGRKQTRANARTGFHTRGTHKKCSPVTKHKIRVNPAGIFEIPPLRWPTCASLGLG